MNFTVYLFLPLSRCTNWRFKWHHFPSENVIDVPRFIMYVILVKFKLNSHAVVGYQSLDTLRCVVAASSPL